VTTMPLTLEDIRDFEAVWDKATRDPSPVSDFMDSLWDVLQRPILDDQGNVEGCLEEVARVLVRLFDFGPYRSL